MERLFTWDEANARVGTAQTTEEFSAAAGRYRDLIAQGVRNGPLFYNYGTCLLMAEDYQRALSALLRAERHVGANDDILRNLRIAAARAAEGGRGGLPWYRVPLFWHYGLAAPVRLGIALGGFSLLWVGWALARLGLRGTGRRLVILAVVAMALFGSSSVATWQGEMRDQEDLVREQSLFDGEVSDVVE